MLFIVELYSIIVIYFVLNVGEGDFSHRQVDPPPGGPQHFSGRVCGPDFRNVGLAN